MPPQGPPGTAALKLPRLGWEQKYGRGEERAWGRCRVLTQMLGTCLSQELPGQRCSVDSREQGMKLGRRPGPGMDSEPVPAKDIHTGEGKLMKGEARDSSQTWGLP